MHFSGLKVQGDLTLSYWGKISTDCPTQGLRYIKKIYINSRVGGSDSYGASNREK